MKIILAIDSFKNCLTSKEVEEIFAQKLKDKGIEVLSLPMSDGGEGMLEVFITALQGRLIEARIHDPLMRPITAQYGITPNGTAIIETAKACGLTLMSIDERNPMVATTYGVGELIAHAVRQGCQNFIIGLGGSGTSDAGIGMLKAIVDNFAKGRIIDDVLDNHMAGCRFTLASDVRNPLYGEQGAAFVFAAQKGATPTMIKELDRRTQKFARVSALHMGKDESKKPGAGAAGGLGYAFMQYFNATVQSGADLLLDFIHFDDIIQNADLIITGEGHADQQTLMGKLPERILQRGKKYQKPVWLIAGEAENIQKLTDAGFAKVDSITPKDMDIQKAINPKTAEKNIIEWVNKNISNRS